MSFSNVGVEFARLCCALFFIFSRSFTNALCSSVCSFIANAFFVSAPSVVSLSASEISLSVERARLRLWKNLRGLCKKADVTLPFSVVAIKVFRDGANAVCWQSYAATIPIHHGSSPMEKPYCSIRLPLETNRAVWLFQDRKSTRLNSSHVSISYAVFC